MHKTVFQGIALACAIFATSQAQASVSCRISEGPSAISSIVADGNGGYHYQIAATGGYRAPSNTYCGAIYDLPPSETPGYMTNFFLPYFSDMGVANVQVSASGFGNTSLWNYTLEESNNLFGIGGGVMHFYTNANSDNGFFGNRILIDFDAAFSGTKGPFQEVLYDASKAASRNYLGDPDIPGSPMAIEALKPNASAVPEPSTIALLGLGAVGLLVRRKKYRAHAV